MNKVLLQNQQPIWLARLLEILLQLRVDVKKELPQQFKGMLQQGYRRTGFAGQPRLWKVQLRELYDVRNKLGRGRTPLSECISIEFSQVNKRNAEVELVEIWKFNVKTEPPPDRLRSFREEEAESQLQRMLADFLETIFKLPLWQDYWNNIQNRRAVKQNYLLNYRISYVEEPLPESFSYDSKMTKQWQLPEAFLGMKIYYVAKPSSLCRSTAPKKQIEKTVLCHKVSSDSHSTRKKSVYEYYDDELQVTFVSSEGEFNLGENSMSEVTFQTPCEAESDEQYELIVENEQEVKWHTFQSELRKLKERANAIGGSGL